MSANVVALYPLDAAMKGLRKDVTEICEFFAIYGRVRNVAIVKKTVKLRPAKNRSKDAAPESQTRAYAFVEFSDKRDADFARHVLHNTTKKPFSAQPIGITEKWGTGAFQVPLTLHARPAAKHIVLKGNMVDLLESGLTYQKLLAQL